MSGGGIADKRGNWYEEHYVLLQALRVLAGDVESLRWERGGGEEDGIDCALRERDVPIECQCKTRSKDQWTLKRLSQGSDDGPGFLAYAKAKLDADPECLVRFVTNARGPELEQLIEAAHRVRSPDEWAGDVAVAATLPQLAAVWSLPMDASGTERAFTLIKRLEFRVADKGAMSEFADTLARLLAGTDAALLRGELLRHLKASLTRTLHAHEIERAIRAAGVHLEPRANDPRIAERLDDLASRFESRVQGVRRLPVISRAELVAKAVAWFNDGLSATTLVVHGPAGAGKTEVVAAVVTELRSRGAPVLVVLPDQTLPSLGLGADPIVALARHAAQRTSLLVIDQLDQVLHGDGNAQQMIDAASDLIRRARRLGVRVLIGCRTVDAEHDTQLNFLLHDSASSEPTRIEVGDLEPDLVAAVLANERIDAASLSAHLLRVARRPFHLSLLVALRRDGQDVAQIATATGLVDQWWSYVRAPFGDAADAVMDTLIGRMWDEGRFSVPGDGVAAEIVEHLVRSGVLVREVQGGAPVVRTSHQLFADVRVAQHWRGASTFTELLELIGGSERQSLHQARRLRLTVPLIATGISGPTVLDGLVRSEAVRPLLKRSALMGIAAIDAPSPALVAVVVGWLREPAHQISTIKVVLWGRPAWVSACSMWLDETWHALPAERREWVVRLVGAVSAAWSDGAAGILDQWIREDPTTARHLAHTLGGEPWEDSDRLFALRLRVARTVSDDLYLDWPQDSVP